MEIVKYDVTKEALVTLRAKYGVTDEQLDALVAESSHLVITDLDNKEQYEAVREKRLALKKFISSVENNRKAQKADALSYGKAVDSIANQIKDKVIPERNRLKYEEAKVEMERERIKAEEEAKQRVIIQARVDELLKYGKPEPFMKVAMLDGEEYDTFLFDVKEEWKEKERVKAEDAEKADAEKKRLADQKKAQDKIATDQKATQDKIDADRKAIDDEKNLIAKTKADEIAAEEAAFKAEQDKLDEAERKAKEQVERDEKRKADKERQETLKPDKKKLNEWVEKLSVIQCADLSSEDAQGLKDDIYHKFDDLCDWARKQIEEL